MSKSIKLSIETVDNVVNYIQMLQEQLPLEQRKPDRDQAEAIADMLIELADAR
jgi:hypothetical protein